jgi:hypothetical protein
MSGRALCLVLAAVWSVVGGFIGAPEISRRAFAPVSATRFRASTAGRIAVDVPAAVTPSGVEEAFRRYQAARAPLGTLDALVGDRGHAPIPLADQLPKDGSRPGLIVNVAILAGVVFAALARSVRPSVAAFAAAGTNSIKYLAKNSGGKKSKIKVKRPAAPRMPPSEDAGGAEGAPEHEGWREVLSNIDRQFQRYRVLVMDVAYRPVDVIDWKQGLLLDIRGKGDVLEYYDKSVRSARDEWPLPAVVVTQQNAHQALEHYALTKMNIQARDDFRCQYCGTDKKPFTIDHVLPKSRNGVWEWENLVCCCSTCNSKKGNKTPQEANMPLRCTPTAPRPGSLAPPRLRSNLRSAQVPNEWSIYIERAPFMKNYRAGERGADRRESVAEDAESAGSVKPATLPAKQPHARSDEELDV